jgi:hypothetical protein
VLCSIYKIHLKYTKNSQTLTIRKWITWLKMGQRPEQIPQ